MRLMEVRRAWDERATRPQRSTIAPKQPVVGRWQGRPIDTGVTASQQPDTIGAMTKEVTDYSEVRLAELIMPNHTNHHGTLFGGHALGLMDHAGWVAATRCARRTMVTVASDRVEFKVPVRAGQLVELVARVTRVGTTSVTVGVDMFAEDVATGDRRLATSGSFVFVAIGDDGKPTPIAKPGSRR